MRSSKLGTHSRLDLHVLSSQVDAFGRRTSADGGRVLRNNTNDTCPPYLGPAHPQSRCLRPNASAKIEVWRKPNHSLALTFPLPWFGEHRNHHRCRFDGPIAAISQFESCLGVTATHTEIVSPRSSAQPILVLRSLRITMAAGLYLRGELTLSANGECEAIWAS